MTNFIEDLKLDISMVKRVLIGLFVLMVLFLFVLLVRKTFAEVMPVNEVSYMSEKTSFKNDVGGSFKVTESVKWLSNTEAEVSFKVDSKVYEKGKTKDIILVVNDSNFVNKKSYNNLKDALKVNVNKLLKNGNRVGLITYDKKAIIASNLTENYNQLIAGINRISIKKGTNYYDALCKVDSLLKNRNGKREVVVLMIMNSYPTLNSPLEVSEYNYLKSNYNNLNIIGIQYDLGNKLLDEIKNITDDQYISKTDNIENTINVSTKMPMIYDVFNVEELIDDDYFDINSKVSSSLGKTSVSKNKISWTLDNKLVSGFNATMKFNIKLKSKYKDVDGIFNVSKDIKIKSKIGDLTENYSSKETPIIKNNFNVIYDPNAPKGCVLKNIPGTKSYSIFDSVKVEDIVLECKGYQFKGWEIVNKVKKINDDYFTMGEENVIIRGTWSKIKINLSMEGSIHSSLSIYDLMKSNEVKDSYSNGIHSISNTKKPIYYYKGNSNNNLVFAGFCWKIVRSTKTGGVKIIYNGVSNNNECVNPYNDNLMNTFYYNKYSRSLSDVSYMYGKKTVMNRIKVDDYKYGSSISYENGIYKLNNISDEISNKRRYSCLSTKDFCEEVYYISSYDDNNIYYLTLDGEKNIKELLNNTFVGNNNSYVKAYVDNWYKNRLYRYRNYFEDTVYCNDKSVDENFEFETLNRVKNNNLSLECNKRDSYSVTNQIGNGALTYPIGLLSIDEYVLSSGSIDNGNKFYLMSPYKYNGNSYVFKGKGSEIVSNSSTYIRPVVSLKGNVKIVDGMGTKDDPYVIKLI